METIIENKINEGILKLKNDIKNKVELQKQYKNQRKTVRLKGERTMPTREAAWKCQSNGETLRIMYAAYGMMRGKKFSQIENSYPEENHPLGKYIVHILALKDKYKNTK